MTTIQKVHSALLILAIATFAYGASMLRYTAAGMGPDGAAIYVLDRLTGQVCWATPGLRVGHVRCLDGTKTSNSRAAATGIPDGWELVPEPKN